MLICDDASCASVEAEMIIGETLNAVTYSVSKEVFLTKSAERLNYSPAH